MEISTSVVVYSMEVEKYKEDYPEKNLRKRKWFTVDEAKEKVHFPEVGNMIVKLHEKLKTGLKGN
ncbi:MAG: hypothetical protein P8Y79_16035 [Ignavibacteriaceae bacterium]